MGEVEEAAGGPAACLFPNVNAFSRGEMRFLFHNIVLKFILFQKQDKNAAFTTYYVDIY